MWRKRECGGSGATGVRDGAWAVGWGGVVGSEAGATLNKGFDDVPPWLKSNIPGPSVVPAAND